METINTRLRKTRIKGDGDMEVDEPHEPTTSRTIEAKKKAFAQYVSSLPVNHRMGPIHYITAMYRMLIFVQFHSG